MKVNSDRLLREEAVKAFLKLTHWINFNAVALRDTPTAAADVERLHQLNFASLLKPLFGLLRSAAATRVDVRECGGALCLCISAVLAQFENQNPRAPKALDHVYSSIKLKNVKRFVNRIQVN